MEPADVQGALGRALVHRHRRLHAVIPKDLDRARRGAAPRGGDKRIRQYRGQAHERDRARRHPTKGPPALPVAEREQQRGGEVDRRQKHGCHPGTEYRNDQEAAGNRPGNRAEDVDAVEAAHEAPSGFGVAGDRHAKPEEHRKRDSHQQ